MAESLAGGLEPSISDSELHKMLAQAASRLVAAGLADPPAGHAFERRATAAGSASSRPLHLNAGSVSVTGHQPLQRSGSSQKLRAEIQAAGLYNVDAENLAPVEAAYLAYRRDKAVPTTVSVPPYEPPAYRGDAVETSGTTLHLTRSTVAALRLSAQARTACTSLTTG